MHMKLAIAKTKADLTRQVKNAKMLGKTIVLVPTMGALHAGHISLIERAKKELGAFVVVSIFVNPTQFGEGEDFDRYPRTLEEDTAKLEKAGAQLLFLPDVSEIYPGGFATMIHVTGLSKRWEGEKRPGHFDGVATVVARLFGLVKPDKAIFGEKDFQQLTIIKRMNEDLALGVDIIGAPTMRESDGLAMSSRNRFLSESEKQTAPRLHETIVNVANGSMNINEAKDALLASGFDKVDYIALVDGQTLEPLIEAKPRARVIAAAWLGKTRLIDNVEVK